MCQFLFLLDEGDNTFYESTDIKDCVILTKSLSYKYSVAEDIGMQDAFGNI